MRNYVIRHDDVIAICDCAVADYNGNIFFVISKEEPDKYVAIAMDGKKYPFPKNSVNLIRTVEGWWKVNAIIENGNDVNYCMDPIDRTIGNALDLVFSEKSW